MANLIQRVGTEYQEKYRNKGFRHVQCDREPLFFYVLRQIQIKARLDFEPSFMDLNPPGMSILNPLKEKSKSVKQMKI